MINLSKINDHLAEDQRFLRIWLFDRLTDIFPNEIVFDDIVPFIFDCQDYFITSDLKEVCLIKRNLPQYVRSPHSFSSYFVNGKHNGTYTEFDRKGNILYSCGFLDDKRHGLEISYAFKPYRVQTMNQFKFDKYCGLKVHFNETGDITLVLAIDDHDSLCFHHEYKKNEKNTDQQLYYFHKAVGLYHGIDINMKSQNENILKLRKKS